MARFCCSYLFYTWENPFLHLRYTNTECLQMNGAVSKVNKKFISHLTRAQRTPAAAATVQVSHALPAVRFSCILRGRGVSFQDDAAAGKGFCVLRFEVSRSVITVQCSAVHGLEKTHRAWGVFSNHKSGNLKIEYTESLFLLRHHLGDWPSGPAVSMRSELLVAHEKLGQLLLLLKPHNFLCVPCILFFILIILTK